MKNLLIIILIAILFLLFTKTENVKENACFYPTPVPTPTYENFS